MIAPLLEKENRTLPQMDLFLAENILLCAGSSELCFESLSAILRDTVAAAHEKESSMLFETEEKI